MQNICMSAPPKAMPWEYWQSRCHRSRVEPAYLADAKTTAPCVPSFDGRVLEAPAQFFLSVSMPGVFAAAAFLPPPRPPFDPPCCLQPLVLPLVLRWPVEPNCQGRLGKAYGEAVCHKDRNREPESTTRRCQAGCIYPSSCTPPHRTNLDRRVQVYMHRGCTPTHSRQQSLTVFATFFLDKPN